MVFFGHSTADKIHQVIFHILSKKTQASVFVEHSLFISLKKLSHIFYTRDDHNLNAKSFFTSILFFWSNKYFFNQYRIAIIM